MRTRILRLLATLCAFIVTFWWLLSHWFYSDLYHQILGFEAGSYNDDFVKIIGTMAIFPLAGFIYTAFEPEKSGSFLTGYIIWSFSMAATYGYTIFFGDVPILELVNAILLVVLGIAFLFLHPSRNKASQTN